MKKVILLICGLLLSPDLPATEDKPHVSLISGKVYDKQTGEALPGVKIHIPDTDVSTYSDLNGNFSITLTTQQATVAAETVGYAPFQAVVKQGTLEQLIQLEPR